MIDKKLCSVHMHLYYKDVSIYLLDRLSKVWNDTIYVSIIKDSPDNKDILSYAQKLFKETRWIEVSNKGTDQYGFFLSNKMNEEFHKPWTLYIHDKHSDKIEWLTELVDVFFEDEYQTIIDQYINSKKTGIIGAEKHKVKLSDYDKLLSDHANTPFKYRNHFVKSVGTLAWMRELQNIFYNKTRIVKDELLNPYFIAGNIFMIRKNILDQTHACIDEGFFEDGYRTDGEVEHAMERFYHYVSECMGYNNIFI